MSGRDAARTKHTPGIDRRALRLAIAAVAIEGYDLSIYAIFAVSIAGAFFPAHDPTSSLLLAVGSFGVGYFVRPIGGVVFGIYADRAGRKAAIALTVLLIALSTGVIALVPSYATIGIAAPIIVVLARLVQGFTAGGATASSISYLIEAAPASRRGFYASFQQSSQVAAFLFATLIGAVISWLCSPSALGAWGWRIPFVLALLFGPVSLLIKRLMPDTEVFVEISESAKPSLRRTLENNWRLILTGFGITCLWNVTTSVLLFYMPTYAQVKLGLSPRDAFLSSTIAAAMICALCPVFGSLGDRIGRKPILITAAVAMIFATYPLLHAANVHRTLAALVVVQLLFAVMMSAYTAVIPAMLGEIFPTRSRATGVSISFNMSILVFAAFGPFFVTWLMATTGNTLAPAFYVMGAGVISLCTLLTIRDPSGLPLKDE